MNGIDITILAVVSFFAVKGLVRGLVNEASSLAGLVLGGWLAYTFYPSLAVPIAGTLHVPAHIASFLAFILILLLTGICAHIIGNVITAALRLVMLGTLNRFGGLLLGAGEGVLLLSMVFSTMTSNYMPQTVKQRVSSSETATGLASLGEHVLSGWRSASTGKP
ncbi:MAG TPA: CvpA family protein [Desulfuromonadales bacterium]|nr:CvpA family protein [Desulfuromonadales bacterium]